MNFEFPSLATSKLAARSSLSYVFYSLAVTLAIFDLYHVYYYNLTLAVYYPCRLLLGCPYQITLARFLSYDDTQPELYTPGTLGVFKEATSP